LISDALPFGRLWYLEVSDAIGYAKFRSRSYDAVIRVYDEAGNVIETHKQAVASSGDFGSIADLMRARLQNGWEECRYTKICQLIGTLPKSDMFFFKFDYYAAIDEERFAVPTGRPYHVLRDHHSRLP
jgi:hypothetical protein